MDLNFGIFRTLEQMEYALKKIKEMRSRFAKARMEDSSRTYNTDLVSALELETCLSSQRSCSSAESLDRNHVVPTQGWTTVNGTIATGEAHPRLPCPEDRGSAILQYV